MDKNKKKLLFVMNSLHCGGAEKALISLLQTIDYSNYTVDLFLFKHEGLFLNQLPQEVTLLQVAKEYKYFEMSLKKAILSNLKVLNFKLILFRILVGFVYKSKASLTQKEQKVWQYVSNFIPNLTTKYDVAIGYMENTPNLFCIDKVTATKKIGFVHNDYNRLQMDKNLDYPYFLKFDKIVTVSELCKAILIENFPNLSEKFEVMHNIVSSSAILKLAQEPIDFEPKGITLISMGRLSKPKGFDVAIEAFKIVIDNNNDAYWYILGGGEERENLEALIAKNKLQERFILLGIKENPYPYLRKATIYVQPSRFEGKPIAIDEAKILNKPMVIANFSTAKDQINDGVDGIIVNLEAKLLANKLELLIKDASLRNTFATELSKKNHGTEQQIEVFYNLLQ